MTTLTWTSVAPTVFTEVTGTFSFNNDDIRAVYVDWGDGTNPAGSFTNKKEYANYQWYTTTESTGSVALTHTYTATGTFNPVVQTVNDKGFISHYTASGASNTEVSPYSQTKGANMDTCVPVDGASTGIMRVENTTVKTGIDNSIYNIEGPNDLYVLVAPTLSKAELAYFCESGDAATGKLEIDLKLLLSYSIQDGDADAQDVSVTTGGERLIKTLTCVLSGANLTGSVEGLRNVLASGAHNLGALESGAQVAQVLEVKLKNPKYNGTDPQAYTQNEVYNKLKICFAAYSRALSAGQGRATYVPVTYITPGDPIKKANDPLRNVNLDFSQSRAKASNVDLKAYRHDLGKGWFQGVDIWGTGSATTFSDSTSGTNNNKTTAYTYMPQPNGLMSETNWVVWTSAYADWNTDDAWDAIENQWVLDDYGRFFPQYHLPRVSVEPSSSATYVSSITTNKPEVFRITPAISWSVAADDGTTVASAANARSFPTRVIDSGTNRSYSASYTDEAFNNASDAVGKNAVARNWDDGMVLLSGMNIGGSAYGVPGSGQWYDAANNERAGANEYLLLMFDKKTNKVFFDISPYADNMQSDFGTTPNLTIGGISYMAIDNKGTPLQNAYWKPLEFEDETAVIKEYRDTGNDTYTTIKAPLSKSGYITYDMPLDWESINVSGACGGVWNTTTIPTSATDYDYGLVTGTVGTAADGTVVGDYIPFTISTSSPFPTDFDDNDIGSFKYIFIRVDDETPAVSGAYWITKDGSDGYDASLGTYGTLYLHLGDKSVTTGADITKGYVRRVSAYDILDGFSKVYRASGGTATELYGTGDEGNWSEEWHNTYMLDSSAVPNDQTIGTTLATAWADEKYLLKISFNTKEYYGLDNLIPPTVWNIFDANEGFESMVKEIDPSAYNLNSLPITSDISISRKGSYYSAITRKGKVFIARTGDTIENISFSSIALGDESTFDTYSSPSALYGQLRKIRGLHGDVCRVYWDEIQKDGTYVRYWGIITSINESHGTGGSRSVTKYSFNVMVEEIALLDGNGVLMTDVFPLGGIDDGKNYT